MARGWESKAVEAQQEDAADRSLHKPAAVSPADAARREEREMLTLARVRMQADLKKASAAAHRTMLEQAIADLDRRIAALQ